MHFEPARRPTFHGPATCAHSICRRNAVLSFLPARSTPLPQPVNDPFIEAIVERIRAVVSRQSAGALEAFANTLSVSPPGFRAFIGEQGHGIDVLFLIDVVAAFVREFAVDPRWLLIGQYDATTHREALLLGEDRSIAGARSLREFVRRLYEQLRSNVDFSPMTPRALRE